VCDMQKDILELLLRDWAIIPQPKTINELAREYLAKQMEAEKGYLPYYRQRRYEKDDTIVFYLNGENRLARVVQVRRDYHYDSDGFRYDAIDVEFLEWGKKLETKSFITNYQGEEYAGSAVMFHVLKEKDEAEIIPEILSVLTNDKQFVAFDEKWLPKHLIVDVSGQLSDIEKIFTECKCPLSTDVILDKIQIHDNDEESNTRLEFSLNYFLNRDRRFHHVDDSGKKWYLRESTRTDVVNVSEKRRWTVTIKPEWLEEGLLKVPRELSNYVGKTGTVHVLYDQVEELLPYSHNNRLINGLVNYYTKKAIAEWDKVHLFLRAIEPTSLFVSCRWHERIERLLQINPTDLKWENISLRDCIIVVLAKFETPAHYREIYAEIAVHKHLSLGSIIATLSRYCPSVFVHVGRGQWGLVGWAEQKIIPKSKQKESLEITSISDEVWEAVANIEEKDYIYELLQRIKKPLSFDEICSRLADYLKVDVQELRATGFLNADDKRLRRLDDGTWALEEWFARDKGQEQPVEDQDDEIGIKETIPEDIPKRSQFWSLLIILFILFFIRII